MTPQMNERPFSPHPQAKPTWTGHLGAQSHYRAVTFPEVGRCYPGADRLLQATTSFQPHTHTCLYSPSGQKVPGVPQGQQDPRKEYQGQETGVRVIHLDSWTNTNKLSN